MVSAWHAAACRACGHRVRIVLIYGNYTCTARFLPRKLPRKPTPNVVFCFLPSDGRNLEVETRVESFRIMIIRFRISPTMNGRTHSHAETTMSMMTHA